VYCLQLRAQGFLYRQVRHMVGATIAVGQHKLTLEYIQRLLREGMSLDMEAGVFRGWNAAEPRGLCKMHVEFPTA
jgi:tRNA U38,U39,U40 pseudouridine synthase TruA